MSTIAIMSAACVVISSNNSSRSLNRRCTRRKATCLKRTRIAINDTSSATAYFGCLKLAKSLRPSETCRTAAARVNDNVASTTAGISAKVNRREDPTCRTSSRILFPRSNLSPFRSFNETYLASRNCEGGDTNAPQKIIERPQPGLD